MSQDDGVLDFGKMTALDALRSALSRAREIHDLVNRMQFSIGKPHASTTASRVLSLVTVQMIGLQAAVAVLDPDTPEVKP